jgi:hypothetical protein
VLLVLPVLPPEPEWPPMLGHEPFIGGVVDGWDGDVEGDVDGVVVVGPVAALAMAMPTPRLRPREPTTAPAARGNRFRFKCSSFCGPGSPGGVPVWRLVTPRIPEEHGYLIAAWEQAPSIPRTNSQRSRCPRCGRSDLPVSHSP